jgi:hypothetical protein
MQIKPRLLLLLLRLLLPQLHRLVLLITASLCKRRPWCSKMLPP